VTSPSLDLAISKNNSNTKPKQSVKRQRCPNRKVYLKAVDHDEGKVVTMLLPCKRWSCPVCGPRLYRQLEKRALKGVSGYIDQISAHANGRRLKYCAKMLTLTWPGRDRRSPVGATADGVTVSKETYSGTETPQEAERLMKKAWNKCRTRLVKAYPDLKFFLVVEPQSDGYPHYHVLVVGSSVIPMSILESVRNIWTYDYGLGNVDIRVPKYGIKGAIRYVMKYMSDPSKLRMELQMKCKRYTSSRGLLLTIRKKNEGRYTFYEMGFLDTDLDGNIVGYREIWVSHDERDFKQVNDERVLKELCDWFDARGHHEQLPLFTL